MLLLLFVFVGAFLWDDLDQDQSFKIARITDGASEDLINPLWARIHQFL